MTTPVVQTGRNRANVMTGAPDVRFSGGFWIGPAVTDPDMFPTDATTAPNVAAEAAGLTTAGFITSDGVTESEDRSTEKILDWNLDVIDVVETDYGLQLTVTCAESANADVLKFIYGEENVTVTEPTADVPGQVHIRKGSRELENGAVMFDIKGKGGAAGRGFGAEVQVQSVGEITYTKSSLIQYPLTIDVLNDVTGTYLHTWLTQRGTVTAGSGDSGN